MRTLGDISNWFYQRYIADPDPDKAKSYYEMAHLTGRNALRLLFLEYVWDNLPEDVKTDRKAEYTERVLGAWDED